MAQYMIFSKTRQFKYKFIGAASGLNANAAIKNARARGEAINSKSILIAIPNSQFMKYQMNPKQTKNKGKMGVSTNWKKAK